MYINRLGYEQAKIMNEHRKPIAFAGHKESINFHKIGGTDAIIRRFSNYLSLNSSVYIFTYGSLIESRVEISPNILIINFITIDTMLNYIESNKISNIFCIYIKPFDRIKILLRRLGKSKSVYHTIITVHNEKAWKRWALFIESIITYNGYKCCVSDRITQKVLVLTRKAVTLYPPVDDSFFVKKERNNNKKIRIAYMGRLDYGKGADIAIEYFKKSNLSKDQYEFFVYSYPWENDKFSMKLHVELKKQSQITYVEASLNQNNDTKLKESIDDVDVFLLPYRFMTSTVDTPLVILEVAARGKEVITTSLEPLLSLTKVGIPIDFINIDSEDFFSDLDLLLKDKSELETDKEKAMEISIKKHYHTSTLSNLIIKLTEKKG